MFFLFLFINIISVRNWCKKYAIKNKENILEEKSAEFNLYTHTQIFFFLLGFSINNSYCVYIIYIYSFIFDYEEKSEEEEEEKYRAKNKMQINFNFKYFKQKISLL